MRASHVLVVVAVAAALACALGVLAGSAGFGIASSEIVWSIRVPRVLAGFGAGAVLVAGAAGAAASEWGIAVGAAIGAAAASALLFGLLWRRLASTAIVPSGEGATALLLVGVMIGAGCSAIVSLILTLADEGQLRGMVFWLLGDLNGASHWEIVWL